MILNIWFYSICYMVTCMLLSIGEKLADEFYNYDSYWIVLFYVNIFFPINIFIFIYKYSFYELLDLCKNNKLLFKMSLSGVIYALETALLYWSLINVPLSVYIIGRTSNTYFNVPTLLVIRIDKKLYVLDDIMYHLSI
jgi:hypothetical protein